MNQEIKAYNGSRSERDKDICERLLAEINKGLPKAENKIWHGSPVWFLDGNPIVGYHSLKNCVRLLFWSGQSFDEEGLAPEGKFKAAEARYTDADEITSKDVQRWLKKAKTIQWDYKNIVKRKGKLVKLDVDAPRASAAKKTDLKAEKKTVKKTTAKIVKKPARTKAKSTVK